MKEETKVTITIVLILLVGAILMSIWDPFDFKEALNHIASLPAKCEALGGQWRNVPMGIECYDYAYDEKGFRYKFYWHIDENGEAYRSKE